MTTIDKVSNLDYEPVYKALRAARFRRGALDKARRPLVEALEAADKDMADLTARRDAANRQLNLFQAGELDMTDEAYHKLRFEIDLVKTRLQRAGEVYAKRRHELDQEDQRARSAMGEMVNAGLNEYARISREVDETIRREFAVLR